MKYDGKAASSKDTVIATIVIVSADVCCIAARSVLGVFLLTQFRSLLVCVWSWDGAVQNTIFSAGCRIVSKKNPRQRLREQAEPTSTFRGPSDK